MTRSSKSPRSSHLTLATGWGECCDIDLDEMSYLLSHLSLSLSLLRSFLFYQTKVPKHKHYTKNGHHQGFRSSGRSSVPPPNTRLHRKQTWTHVLYQTLITFRMNLLYSLLVCSFVRRRSSIPGVIPPSRSTFTPRRVSARLKGGPAYMRV
jgi:hypothetical protein